MFNACLYVMHVSGADFVGEAAVQTNEQLVREDNRRLHKLKDALQVHRAISEIGYRHPHHVQHPLQAPRCGPCATKLK